MWDFNHVSLHRLEEIHCVTVIAVREQIFNIR